MEYPDGEKTKMEEQKLKQTGRELEEQDKKLDDLRPVRIGVRLIKGARDFAVWATPAGIIYAFYNWLRH